MTKTFSLQPLVQLAQQKNDAATKKFGQLNKQQQAAQAKLDTLLQYRKDYQTRFQEAVQNGMNQSDLRNFQGFIQRLDEAIAQQRSINRKSTLVPAVVAAAPRAEGGAEVGRPDRSEGQERRGGAPERADRAGRATR